jgi:anti-anti-sigma factor
VVSARIGEGEVFDSAKLKNTVRFLIENDMRNVVIDLGNLEYLYSDTINAFIASNRHMLEVSGRIAILTEHPKVQDILKRAGLDNIMRIYRSEAEMIADSKEILRQTSSYRIEELQKISTQPSQPAPEPPPAPRTEFDDFKMEMGARLGSKLENNEVPQYQLGINQSAAPAAFGATPAPRETAAPYPTFNAPAFGAPPSPDSAPSQGQPSYAPPHSAPGFGGFNNAPAFGQGANGATGMAGLGGSPAQPAQQGFNQAAPPNFDFPTVQLPVGAFNGAQNLTAPPAGAPSHGFPPSEPGNDPSDPRGRKPSQERMRSPNARRQQGRRVGGRELPGGIEDAPETSAYAPVESEPEIPPPSDPPQYGAYSVPPSGMPSSLVEESRSPFKLIAFVIVLLLLGAGLYFAINRGGEMEEGIPETSVNPEPKPEIIPAPAPETPADPSATEPGAVAAPSAPAAEAPKAEAPKAEPPKAEPPREEPAKVASRAPAPRKPARSEQSRPASKPTPPPEREREREPDPEPTRAAVSSGKLRVTSTPPGAEVLVNFSKKGTTPVEISLNNNSNRIIVRLQGYKRFETTLPKNHPERTLDVVLESDEVASVEPDPEPEPPPAPAPKVEPKEEVRAPSIAEQRPSKPAPAAAPEEKAEVKQKPVGDGPIGVIFLSSSPARADILIDGKKTGMKTPAKVELPSGNHRIEMVKSGQRAVVDQLVNEGKNKALHLTLQ